ncbi:MAG: UDP-N-acetylglucosamine 2-epimerase (non-hydrolyzing) [candidate division Zixibacteria bacterium]|nr:UDP-N-acetylglucosamine 2-epimerase (non-hydrolyzing) [candidate division Zixibacteria bacterium]
MKKIAVVVGARPQFIKLAPVVEIFSDKVKLVIIHTGQHYDFEMSDVFFHQLNLPQVDYHLGIGSDSQAAQVGRMMIELEKVFVKESPDMTAVIGDTNSTLAGALAAAKNNIPLAHIEAGLRSNNNHLPEQINRVVTDHLSNIFCCPTQSSVDHLKAEGIKNGIFLTGDILYDVIDRIIPDDEFIDSFLAENNLKPGDYILFTVHRAENADSIDFLQALVAGLENLPWQIFLPLHPRTKGKLEEFGLMNRLSAIANVRISEPVGIIESLALTKSSLGVMTDSGGLQREAAFFGKKSYILRDETEWLELKRCGAVVCIKSDLRNTEFDWNSYSSPGSEYFQKASQKIADCIINALYMK